MTKKNLFVPIVLGLMTAFGPIITDFYLSVLPEIADYFKTPNSMVQLSLTMGMIGLAIGQLLIGPLTDKFGRKKILVISMLMFAISGAACIFAPNIHVFNATRLFQGIAGAGGLVISRSMANDMYKGRELVSFMAVLQAINGIAPIFAPVIGSGVASFTSWQGVFAVLLAVGVILMICSIFLRETLLPENRLKGSLVRIYGNLFKCFRDSTFTLCVLINMALAFPFFAYISSSPFILQGIYKLSPFAYGICFGVNAVMIGLGSMLSTRFRNPARCIMIASTNYVLAAIAVSLILLLDGPIWLLMPAYIYLVMGFGLAQPPIMVLALDSQREHAGAASAVLGSSLFVAGGLASPLSGIGDICLSTSMVSIEGAAFALVLSLLLFVKMKETVGTPGPTGTQK